MREQAEVYMHFTDCFEVDPTLLDSYGAFDVSLVNDLPLFIDPFLLFNSEKDEYRAQHESMIRYLRFLRDEAIRGATSEALIGAWYTFPELKQMWLGFSQTGNAGRGLGRDFASSLHRNLNTIFSSFGNEVVTRGSHIEKLTLIRDGVGRDKISDFTTNLIKEYLLCYTEQFAKAHLQPHRTSRFAVRKVRFNYETESWESGLFVLPRWREDFVILTPKDMLTRDDMWISRSDMMRQFEQIVYALPNDQLRAQLNRYLKRVLPAKPTAPEKRAAITLAARQYPELLEYYIRFKEDRGDEAVSMSEERVARANDFFVDQARVLKSHLLRHTQFYDLVGDTLAEARQRVEFLKDVVENKGGWRVFYVHGKPVRREKDVQILYRLTWNGTPSDVSREVDNGRGPADFKISRGALDKSIVEFKLASNPQLRRNLEKQVEIYKKASDADEALKVIVYFTEDEYGRVLGILDELGIRRDPNVILMDARSDNKPSASKA
ncbi:MAG TPA: hypothetical protein VMW58_11805 [Anaerolineae bacterium]|nr:hypothetical protein [Anaerolineae bacterium]